MNKAKGLEQVFTDKKAFIPFITCGYPSLEVSERMIEAMARSGADLIELGIPFSDPTAEGAVIEQASLLALQNGTRTDCVFAMIARVRERCDVALAIMTYANIVFAYGIEKFCQKANALGICALILPDVPYEESAEFRAICERYNIALISFVAPTSSKERIEMIAKAAQGFIYCVSSLGVTGERSALSNQLQEILSTIKAVKNIPVCVGFGISTPAQASEVAHYADGVIVGSAIVKRCLEYKDSCIEPISAYVKEMKEAISKD
ncbi:tryptophan synthase subunit alpha [Helicobacter himalayensis]|uniref:tryptophan synthase subunit alpha n=1 Tax=Helicobacter himalayensis TaxID=1591088 RepID=UPI003D6FD9F7